MTENNNQMESLKKRIPYDEDLFGNISNYNNILEILLEDSKNKCLSILYHFEDYSEMELPKKYYNWQLRACVEMFNLADKAGIVNYSENGINWSKLTDGLSLSLLNEITPKVNVPKKIEIKEEDSTDV